MSGQAPGQEEKKFPKQNLLPKRNRFFYYAVGELRLKPPFVYNGRLEFSAFLIISYNIISFLYTELFFLVK